MRSKSVSTRPKKRTVEILPTGAESPILLRSIPLDSKQKELIKLMKEDNSYTAIFDLVHKQHLDINFHDEQGKTPMILAIEKSNRSFVRILLKQPNININMTDTAGCTPLIKSIISNRGTDRLRIIIHLIQTEGINLNLTDKETRQTALVHAVLLGDLEVCRILVKAGAEINMGKKTKDRVETPLYHAKVKNHTQIVAFLEAHGATELLLLTEKLSPNRTSTDYNKKLMLLSSQKADLPTVADLIKKGVDPNYIDRFGQLPIQVAIENQNLLLLRLLLKSPLLDINIRFGDVQCTPIIFAAKQKQGPRLEIIKTLIQSSVDVNTVDKNGRSALTYACFFGDYDLVKTLLDADASVNNNSDNPNSVSPIVFAKRHNHISVVNLLLQYGAVDMDIAPVPLTKSHSVKLSVTETHELKIRTSKSKPKIPASSAQTSPINQSLSPRASKYRTSPAFKTKNQSRRKNNPNKNLSPTFTKTNNSSPSSPSLMESGEQSPTIKRRNGSHTVPLENNMIYKDN
jgi:ankyrin repeat protein